MTEASIDLTQVKQYLTDLQHNICTQLADVDGMDFLRDHWTSNLGTGTTQVIDDGNIFEKGGVNFSHVQGARMPASASANRPELADMEFEAMGVSLVLHPKNPFVPTTHMNVRLFTAQNPQGKNIWWFGGGYDLTPYYAFEEDCVHWHQIAKSACDPFDASLYKELRDWCRKYFFLKHRDEPRGIGGLFFDDFNRWDFDQCFTFLRAVGDSFCPAYIPIINKRRHTPYTNKHVEFQQIRRGRYVEFNLVYDRGTIFGLQSGGRTESILMSLPKNVQWHYNWQPKPGSEEACLTETFLPRIDWL